MVRNLTRLGSHTSCRTGHYTPFSLWSKTENADIGLTSILSGNRSQWNVTMILETEQELDSSPKGACINTRTLQSKAR